MLLIISWILVESEFIISTVGSLVVYNDTSLNPRGIERCGRYVLATLANVGTAIRSRCTGLTRNKYHVVIVELAFDVGVDLEYPPGKVVNTYVDGFGHIKTLELGSVSLHDGVA